MLSTGAKAGIAIGVVIAVLLLLLTVCFILRRRLKRTSENTDIASDEFGVAGIAGVDAGKAAPTTVQKLELSRDFLQPELCTDAEHGGLIRHESLNMLDIGTPLEQLAVTKDSVPELKPTVEQSNLSREYWSVSSSQTSDEPRPIVNSQSSNVEVATPPPQTEEEYIAYVGEFVTNNINEFFDPKEEFAKGLAEKAAAHADIVTSEFDLAPEVTPQLVKLAFYDFVILCDDSSSMTYDEQCIPALKDTLSRVARFATILEPKGISVRFLNYNEGISGEFDNLTDAGEIEEKIGKVPFSGVTRLGEVLDCKIVQPMIIQKVEKQRLEKPIFVVIITDGHPSGEPPESLRNTILKCKESLTRRDFRNAAAVFLISQVGNSKEARTFLKELENDKEVGDMVFCSTENLDERLAAFQHSNDKKYTAWLVELFLAALDKQTRR